MNLPNTARGIAEGLAMRLTTPVLPDDGAARLDCVPDDGTWYSDSEWNQLSHGERSFLHAADLLRLIGWYAEQLDDRWRSALAGAMHDLARHIDPEDGHA